MRICQGLTCVVLLVIVGGSRVPAASPRDALVVTSTWLAQHIDDPNLVLLHVGPRADYDANHIPGARYVAYGTDLAAPNGGLSLEMLPPDLLRDRLAALGISDDSRVVVYFAKGYVSPSTRVIFTLDYAGLGNAASALDGGMDVWVRDGHQLTSVVPSPRTGQLSPLKTRSIVVDGAFVLAHLKTPTFAIVDARDASFYDGVQAGDDNGTPQRPGHIAGAHSVPFNSVHDDQLLLRSPAELQAIFAKAGVKPDDTVIGYCHIGQQATAMLFAARTLGHPVLLYDGSFQDWSRHADYPVENPAKKGGGW